MAVQFTCHQSLTTVHEVLKMKKFFSILMMLTGVALAQSYQPTPENLKSRQWFQDNKFGLFIHWGVYSVLGKGEWVMNNDKIAVADYEKLPERFNPTEFNPPNGSPW